ncbi:MAG TPA: tetratricopeptide repeat protein [Ktedonobacteraceae bacterium]|nr:tetratricopeptide repeat protein [Ktedonobacteraceae bacterium]
MDDAFVQALQAAKNPEEKATLVAEASLDTLPRRVAFVARQCVLFHWFDQSITEGLLQAFAPNGDHRQDAYGQIISLPFIEHLLWGVTYQDLTRQGLLKHLVHTQPELLKSAAQIAAPLYKASPQIKRGEAEALFCSIVSGDTLASSLQIDTLLEQAMSLQDWQSMEGLFRLQEEAEQLSFVEPIPRTEHYWMLRSVINRVQNKPDEALVDYNHALTINPKNALAYLNRGIIHLRLHHYELAEADYNQALRFDPVLAQVYVNNGVRFLQQKPDKNKDLISTQQLPVTIGNASKSLTKKIKEFVVALWNLLVEWAGDWLEAWTKVHLPTLSNLVKEAYILLDQQTVAVRRSAKKAWRELRKYLLKQTISILQIQPGIWVYRIATWIIDQPETNKVTQVKQECSINWGDLPVDIRMQIIRYGEIGEIDVVKTRDTEFEMLVSSV